VGSVLLPEKLFLWMPRNEAKLSGQSCFVNAAVVASLWLAFFEARVLIYFSNPLRPRASPLALADFGEDL
jgi:hypothetical protein